MTLLLLPCEPGAPRRPDPQFTREADAARAVGFDVALLDHDALEAACDGDAALLRARLPEPPATWAYRGWMMAAPAYAALAAALHARGFTALTGADAYCCAHHGPCMAPHIAPWTARSAAVPVDDLSDGALRAALALFGDGAAVVKDWVKSQAAGHWADACFIPRASDTDAALRVVRRFQDLQGPFLVGGVVLKAHHRLLGQDGRACGDGRAVEWRCFVVKGEVTDGFCRDEDGTTLAGPPATLLRDVAQAVPSPFFAMDWAAKAEGGFLLLEVGDGGVSGLPDWVDPAPLLSVLKRQAEGLGAISAL